jgi:inhibitor of KinA sporulation pathway (predicted exonuclease)
MDFTSLLIVDILTAVWEKPADMPAGQANDIIAADIVLVDTEKNQIIEKDSYLVKPKTSKISTHCEKLYGISQTHLDTLGVSFEEVYRRLRVHYMSRDRIWGSWGNLEKYALDKQCRQFELECLFTQTHLDIQRLYSIMTGFRGEYVSCIQALEKSFIESTSNRAVNIANIYMRMAKGLRQQPKSRIISPSNYGYGN